MDSPAQPPGWYRHRYVWVAVILLAVTAGAVALVRTNDSAAGPADLRTQIMDRMRATLEQSGPQQHQHAGHSAAPSAAAAQAAPPVVSGVRVYGYEPAAATTLAGVRTVYGFHLCGIAEPERPWDVAVKLAGPLILDMSADPPGIRVVEATPNVKFVDRLRQMFPGPYAEMALTEALSAAEMAALRQRYAAAAGL